MGGLKGHPNYNTSKDPQLNGGALGYLGKPETYYTDELLEQLGKGLVEWIQQKNNIWCNYYYCTKGISKDTVRRLCARSEMFRQYNETAKNIQESKLLTDPYLKKTDGNHARFMLARHHKGEWEEKPLIVTEDQEKTMSNAVELLDHLQSQAKPQVDDNVNPTH